LNESAADALAFVRRIYDQRAKQGSIPLRADRDGGEADASQELAVERRAQRERSHRRHAFAHPGGAPRETSGAESFGRKPRQSRGVAIGFEANFKGGRHRSWFQQADQRKSLSREMGTRREIF